MAGGLGWSGLVGLAVPPNRSLSPGSVKHQIVVRCNFCFGSPLWGVCTMSPNRGPVPLGGGCCRCSRGPHPKRAQFNDFVVPWVVPGAWRCQPRRNKVTVSPKNAVGNCGPSGGTYDPRRSTSAGRKFHRSYHASWRISCYELMPAFLKCSFTFPLCPRRILASSHVDRTNKVDQYSS